MKEKTGAKLHISLSGSPPPKDCKANTSEANARVCYTAPEEGKEAEREREREAVTAFSQRAHAKLLARDTKPSTLVLE